MDAKFVHPRLVLPTEIPQSDKGWSCVKLTDERATSVLEQMNTDLKPGNTKAAKVTGAMLLWEFLMLRVAPLLARTRPLWRLGDEEDKVRLSSEALPDGELAAALRLLVGDDQEYPPSAFVPLFRRKDGAQIVAARPTFDGRGLVPPAPTGAPMAPTAVELSSDESRGEEEEEDKEHDLEVAPEWMGETSPLSKANILCTLPNDERTDARQEKGEPPVIPTRDRTALIPRDATSIPPPPGATSGPSAGPSSALGARAPAPQASRLSGFKLSKRRVDYAAVDQLPPAAKKRKDAAAQPGAEPSAVAAPPSAKKGSDGTRTSPARSSSQGLGEHPHEGSAPVAPLALEALVSGPAAGVTKAEEPPVSQALVTTSSPPPAAPLLPGPSVSPDVLEPTLSQAAATSEKERQAVAQAVAAREVALKDAEIAQDRCRALEAELRNLHDLRAEEARGRQTEEEKMKAWEDAVKDRDAELGELVKAQAAERSRLEELERKVEAEKADLGAKVKVLTEDRAAFVLLEKRSRAALKALYEKGLERPLTTDEDGPAQLLPYLVDALEEVVNVNRRQGSTDSDEHARPKKKKTTTKKKKWAPSTSPSASDPDDEDYVGEEEDDFAPRHSVGQSKPGTRRALVPPVHGTAMPVVHGRRISMELPDSGDRLPHNFTTVGAGPYLEF
nr:transcription initiation factor TFIID subunit 3-like [Aegilops tauschii subsp. strangulata]